MLLILRNIRRIWGWCLLGWDMRDMRPRANINRAIVAVADDLVQNYKTVGREPIVSSWCLWSLAGLSNDKHCGHCFTASCHTGSYKSWTCSWGIVWQPILILYPLGWCNNIWYPRSKRILNTNLAKSRLFITYLITFIWKSFWNFAQSMAEPLDFIYWYPICKWVAMIWEKC